MTLAAPRLPRLLVTGANGFVMRQCIRAWLALGYHVLALDTHFDPATVAGWQATGRIDCIRHTLDDQPIPAGLLPAGLLPAVDAIVHGAAITAEPAALGLTPEQHLSLNVLPALALLDWAHIQGARLGLSAGIRVVLVSSSAVYARTEGEVNETQPVSPRGTYAIAKATLEHLAETLRSDYARDVIAVRLGNLYGVGETPSETRPRISLIGHMLHAAVSSGVVPVPAAQPDPHTREWTFAPDVAYALHALLQTPHLPHALYNVASGALYDRFAIADAIEAALPGIHRERVDETVSPLARRGWLSSARLRETTGFSTWTPLERGIARAVASLQSRYSGALP
jgi:nucleoside-diphosphate-sugar epimerase